MSSTYEKQSLILFLFVILIYGCNNPESKSNDQNSLNTSNNVQNSRNTTFEMINKIQEAWAKVDPSKIKYHLNEERYNSFMSDASRQEGVTKISSQIKAANELLVSGKPKSAILLLQKIMAEALEEKTKINSNSVTNIRKLVALAYIRVGQEENSIGKSEGSIGIIPFAPEAIHKVERGSKTAIDIYKSLLASQPQDQEIIWLLNLAYMTLGLYPDEVPKEYLIDPAFFSDRSKIQKFTNVAIQNNLDLMSLGGGAIIEDFNNDGLLDIFTSGWAMNETIQLLINTPDGFINNTKNSGLIGMIGGLNMIQGDYNNDGLIDIFVLRGAWLGEEGKIPNSLLKNNGNGSFSDVTLESGLLSYNPTQTAAFSDFNLDGHLDLIVGNENAPIEYFINQKDGTFKNESVNAQLDEHQGYTKGISVGDLNNDNYPDIYLSNFGQPNKLLLNTGGQNPLNIKFVDITEFSGTSAPFFSFPSWFFDYNNDGLEDIFVGGFTENQSTASSVFIPFDQKNDSQDSSIKLYKNNGDNTFQEISTKLGLNKSHSIMGSNFGDLDNDGWKDFYLGTGNLNFKSIVPNRMYRNKNGSRFIDVTFSGGFGHIQKGNAISFADLDNDGDQDIYAVMGGPYEGEKFQNALFKNPFDDKNNWIKVRLKGNSSNHFAIGARIKIIVLESGKYRTIYHTITNGSSFGGNPLLAEIGLGKATRIEELEVTWPTIEQNISIFKNIAANQLLFIEENKKDYTTFEIKHSTLKN